MTGHHAWITRALSVESSSIPDTYKKPSLDVLHVVRERFSIDDARELSELSLQRPFESEKRTFVIVTGEIAVEAQHALLKLLEEPPHSALFYILLPQTSVLLPTLQSRLMELISEKLTPENESFSQFEHASYAERLALVAQKATQKDTVWMEAIVTGCEKASHELKNATLMRTVLLIRRYLRTKGASDKMLLEALALSLPLT